jgi:hypothetical protein
MFSVEFAKLFIYRYDRASFKDVQLGGGRHISPGDLEKLQSASLYHCSTSIYMHDN